MTFEFRVHAVLTDIEGTTTSLSFVKDVLFPYARAALPGYVAAHAEELRPLLKAVAEQADGDPVATLLRWIDEDRKMPALKAIQGMIWADGYRGGAFTGHVFPDAVDALRRWHAQGVLLSVYSSGSVAAQKLLYGHSDAGDLTPLFSNWFDLEVGSKLDAASYRAIAHAISGDAEGILFLSDHPGEIAAAHGAGLATLQLDRDAGSGASARDFSEILLVRAT